MFHKGKYIFLLPLVLLLTLSSCKHKANGDNPALKIVSVVKSDSVAAGKQTFVVLRIKVRNITDKTVENFSMQVNVHTSDGDSLSYLIFHSGKIAPGSQAVCYQPLEVNTIHPIEKKIFDLPQDSLRFDITVTELKLGK